MTAYWLVFHHDAVGALWQMDKHFPSRKARLIGDPDIYLLGSKLHQVTMYDGVTACWILSPSKQASSTCLGSSHDEVCGNTLAA